MFAEEKFADLRILAKSAKNYSRKISGTLATAKIYSRKKSRYLSTAKLNSRKMYEICRTQNFIPQNFPQNLKVKTALKNGFFHQPSLLPRFSMAMIENSTVFEFLHCIPDFPLLSPPLLLAIKTLTYVSYWYKFSRTYFRPLRLRE